ncbi:MAG: 30S ribosomal protein S12 methylthiotransferase accessory protein YcaO, partial [Gammaproteobacteria bacterium]
EEALDMAEWVITFGASTMSAQRQTFYRCLIEQLQLALDEDRNAKDYEWIHRQLYGDEIYETVCQHINGQSAFYGLSVIGDDCENFTSHQQLLTAYRKWQVVKN